MATRGQVFGSSIVAAYLSLAGVAVAQVTRGADYPDRPVRVVVPYTPGGGTDLVARMIAQKLTEATAQPFVVDNRPAVDGVVGTEIVAKSQPDGYTLLLVSTSHAINAALGRKLPYDTLKDFAPIVHTANQQLILVVHPSVPAKSVKDLVALAKAKPDAFNYGSSSNATALPTELFKAMTGVQIQHIPYKGSGPMLTDLIGGQIQMSIAAAISAIPHVKSGKLRALAIADSKRSTEMPDLPTIAEAGVPGYQATIWTGMVAPAKTPAAIIERLNREVVQIVRSTEFRARLIESGAEAAGSTPAEWGSFLRAEIAKWQKIARRAGMIGE
ncbi:MAG: tripartite tricarboxylate transporter substrate binding protein [Proteobacteria bacterium]|nr:tripartite tricarboxylate transporter substrate binding protein [Burkholderiales bacterium]